MKKVIFVLAVLFYLSLINLFAAYNPYNLKEFFPIGPAWGWERTRAYAKSAGMELWEFVDRQLNLLREHGCNTIWVVNLSGGEDLHKLLKVAEKNNIKVLTSSAILNSFYHGINDLESIDNSVRRHIVTFGNYPALLGYVLKDEPYVQCLENCSYFYKVFKKYDKKRDAVAVVMNRQSPTYIRESKLPVICTDLYYFGDKDSIQILNTPELSKTIFSENLRTLNRNSAMFGKTHWFMGQLFGDVWGKWYFTSDYKVVVEPGAYLHWQMPTEAIATWQVWEALRNGSKGLFMYVMHGSAPCFTPPDKAVPDSAEAKRYAKLEKLSKQAASWKGQKLTKERMIIDFHEGWVYPNGKPTPQMTALGKVFRELEKHAKFIVSKKFADFPVFFSDDSQFNITTYENNDAKRYGIAVNRNTDTKRTVKVYLPLNVTAVKDMISNKSYKITKSAKNFFNEISFELPAGGGTILEAEFATEHVGMPVCHETFDLHSYHRVNITANGQVVNFGEIRMDSNRAVKMVKSPSEPVCILKNLANPKRANNTFSLNVAKNAKRGTLYCMLEGRLDGVTVKAVTSASSDVKNNFQHLKEETVNGKKTESKSANSVTICDKAVNGMAIPVPHNATALEFYINNQKSLIDDIYIWFVPANK